MKDIHTQDPTVRAFFATHNSSEVSTAPEMTKEMLLTIQDQIPELLARSPVLVRVVGMDGLIAHRDSMNTLLACLYHLKCEACDTSPQVFQAMVYHPEGVVAFLEDRAIHYTPPDLSWAVPEGFHFVLNCRYPACAETFNCIATYLPDVGRRLNADFMAWGTMKDPTEPVGFIARPSWITTYFQEKKFDQAVAQRTVLGCTQSYLDLKKARRARRLPKETFHAEVTEGILDVLRNLIPQVTSELEFCGLIKGAHLFTSISLADEKYQFKNLDPSTPFSFKELQREFHLVAHNISHSEKKKRLASAILSVDRAYRAVTPSSLVIPAWVNAYRFD